MWIVCAATEFELAAWPSDLPPDCYRVVSGVGIPETIATLLPLLSRSSPSLIINIGIAGAYPGSGLSIGDLVCAEGEVYGDLGMELPEQPGFRLLSETPFGSFYQFPFPTIQPSELIDETIARRRGATVNACTGTDATGRLRETLTQAGFETMEGAAVAQIGASFGIPVCELRAISNIAAERDMRPENIRLAIEKLREYLSFHLRTN